MFIQPRFEQVDVNAGNYRQTLVVSSYRLWLLVKKLFRKQVRDFLVINLHGFKELILNVNLTSRTPSSQFFSIFSNLFTFWLLSTSYDICLDGWVFTSTKMVNQSNLYQNEESVALVQKIFNWPKTIKPNILSSWLKVTGGRATRVHAITSSNFCIESYPLLASSQHVGATAAVTILLLSFL